MNGKATRRTISVLLSILLFFEFIPFQAFAEESDSSETVATEEPVMEEADIDTGSGTKSGEYSDETSYYPEVDSSAVLPEDGAV